MDYISFPGLGIQPFHIDKTAFTVFNIPIAWYGIIICIGLVLAVFYSIYRANKSEGLKTDTVTDLAFFLVILSVIGARLYYVIFSFDSYIVHNEDGSFDFGHTLLKIINIREGGLAIYGAIIAGFFTVLVFAKIKKISALKILDFVSPSVMIGQIIGRWGNFVNMEAHGTETTLPWRMGLHFSKFSDPSVSQLMADVKYYHPTFLYESLWNLIGFIIINVIYKKKKFNGQIFFLYISWYGLGRAFIEGFRTDSLMLGNIRISQLVGAVTFIAGIVLLIVMSRRSRKTAADTSKDGNLFSGDGPEVASEPNCVVKSNENVDEVKEFDGGENGTDN